MNVFLPADILIPDVESMEKWSVIACDQFSSQPEYWKDVKETVGDAPSSFHLIFPEAELEDVDENEKIKTINWNMHSYLEQGIFQKYEKSYVKNPISYAASCTFCIKNADSVLESNCFIQINPGKWNNLFKLRCHSS